MAYKNRAKNKLHIEKLRKDPTNWRAKLKDKKKKSQKQEAISKLRKEFKKMFPENI